LHRIESSEHLVEHAVHFAVKRKKWMNIIVASGGDLASSVPGDDICDGHGVAPLITRGFRRRQCRVQATPWLTSLHGKEKQRSGRFGVKLRHARSGRPIDRDGAGLHLSRQAKN
jgi:hypothetical protein